MVRAKEMPRRMSNPTAATLRNCQRRSAVVHGVFSRRSYSELETHGISTLPNETLVATHILHRMPLRYMCNLVCQYG
jgi:hypothetical protein